MVLRFFPNEVSNFEPVVGLLGRLNQVVSSLLGLVSATVGTPVIGACLGRTRWVGMGVR